MSRPRDLQNSTSDWTFASSDWIMWKTIGVRTRQADMATVLRTMAPNAAARMDSERCFSIFPTMAF